jgi:hypothetical protein
MASGPLTERNGEVTQRPRFQSCVELSLKTGTPSSRSEGGVLDSLDHSIDVARFHSATINLLFPDASTKPSPIRLIYFAGYFLAAYNPPYLCLWRLVEQLVVLFSRWS